MAGRLMRIANWEQIAEEAHFLPSRMAAICPVSLRQMERFFVEHFGKTPTAWILELRCSRAKALIAQGYSTKAAAAELKFADESHFCHVFKRFYGVSPQTIAPLYNVTSSKCRV